MSFFNDLKIEKKMMAAFAVVVAAIAIMGMIVFIQINALEKARHDRVRASAVQREAESAMVYLARQESSFRAYLLSRDDYHLQKMAKERQDFNTILERIARMDSRSANDVRSARRSADAWAKSVIEASQSGGAITTTMIGINSATASGSTSIAAVEAELKTLTEAKAEQSKRFGQKQEAVEKQARMVLILGMVFALAMAVGAGFILTQMLGKPLIAMTSAMRRLAAGDTSILVPAIGRRDEVGEMASAVQAFKDAALDKARLEAEAEAERAAARAVAERHEAMAAEENAASQTAITALNEALSSLSKGDLTYRITAHMTRAASLKDDFNKAAEQLEEAIGEVLHNVVAIRSGSGEISQASDDLSRRTEQQAASLEETAAALDEITATVNRTAEGARQASGVVQSARGDAEQSGQVVRDAVAAMGQIEASSNQISNIIGVIDEIAFQTNLLALNAGVEAARAGDAGRGFAVVASEVRALAQRSAEAAKEIKSLISASSRQVGSGVNLVGQTGEALQRIVSRVAEIDSLVSEIAASAQEQATGLQQVNSAVNQMDQVTQQNAAMVEETTAASHSLAREAGSLNKAVQRFRTREVHKLAQAPQVAAPVPAKVKAPVAAPAIAPVASTAEARPEPTPPATSRQAQPVAETIAALKTVGRGGAAIKPQAIEDGWEEF